MLKLGVTGGIGSGKTTVCKIFECIGIPVFHADNEGRRVLNEDKEVQQKVVYLFGPSILTQGKPDRKKIASIVFGDSEKLTQLNAIIHPEVRKSFAMWVKNQTASLVIEEAAILFENGGYTDLDKMVLVTSPEDIRIKRVMQRDHVTEIEVKKRMQKQCTDEEKAAKADFIINNIETKMLTSQVLDIISMLNGKETAPSSPSK